jgi:hypothetical protein
MADPSGVGLTTSEIGRITSVHPETNGSNEALDEAVFEICGDRFDPRRFGRRVRGLKGRVWQGRYIDDEMAGGGVKRWRIRYVESGLSGLGGSNLSAPNHDTSCATNGDCDPKTEGRGLANQPKLPGNLFGDGRSNDPPTGSVIEI